MPGSTGATATPASMPASTRHRTARNRWRGGGVPGSVVRQTSSSRVGIEKLTEIFARDAASASTSTSRTIIGLRVMMWNGLRAPHSASRQARVSR
jgi:hypothetical protein